MKDYTDTNYYEELKLDPKMGQQELKEELENKHSKALTRLNNAYGDADREYRARKELELIEKALKVLSDEGGRKEYDKELQIMKGYLVNEPLAGPDDKVNEDPVPEPKSGTENSPVAEKDDNERLKKLIEEKVKVSIEVVRRMEQERLAEERQKRREKLKGLYESYKLLEDERSAVKDRLKTNLNEKIGRLFKKDPAAENERKQNELRLAEIKAKLVEFESLKPLIDAILSKDINLTRFYACKLQHKVRYPYRRYTIALGGSHLVAIKNDGTLVGMGSNKYGQLNIGHWKDIISVAAGINHTVGLKKDGTIVSTIGDYKTYWEWRDIVAIAAGDNGAILGLSKHGFIRSSGYQSWYDTGHRVVDIDAGAPHLLAVKGDGKVIVSNAYGNTDLLNSDDVASLSEIVRVCAEGAYSLFLNKRGVAIYREKGKLVKTYDNIVDMTGPGYNPVLLRKDGTVYIGKGSFQNAYDMEMAGKLNNVVAVIKKGFLLAALKGEGTVELIGSLNGEYVEGKVLDDIVVIDEYDELIESILSICGQGVQA